MKNRCQNAIFAGALALSLAVIPLAAQPVPEPAASNAAAENTSNNLPAESKRQISTPVRIDGTGIHVGGKDPIDIAIPGLNSATLSQAYGGSRVKQIVPPSFEVPFGAVMITLISVGIPFACLTTVVFCGIYFKYRRNRVMYETVRAMVEKGVPIPPELIVPPNPASTRWMWNDLRIGLVLLAGGAGITIFLGRFGLIVVFIGLAFLVVWLVEKKNKNIGQINP